VKIYLRRLLEAEASELPPALPEPAISGAGRTLLVVEDEALVRQMAVDALEDAGYVVLEAADGPGALRLLEQGAAVDLIITDVGLPGMNGRQLAELVRQRWPAVQVLFTTGYARNAIVHNGTLDPGVELLTKPFTTEALLRKVGQMLAEGSDPPPGPPSNAG
jgi:CheY-like chemotaxis protein